MKHVEFLIWRCKEDKANSKSFSSKELGCNKNNNLCLCSLSSPSTVPLGRNGFGLSPRPKMFESFGFGYYMIAVFRSKGIILRGIQMWLSHSRWCALLHLWEKLIKPSILCPWRGKCRWILSNQTQCLLFSCLCNGTQNPIQKELCTESN